MTTISRIARENSGAEVIDDIDGYSIYSWLNEKHKEAGIGHSNLQTNMTQNIKNVDLN